MAKRKKHTSIKVLNGLYLGLKMFGMFLYLSGKYEVLGVQSIASQFKSKKAQPKDTKTDPKAIKDAQKARSKISASKEPPVFSNCKSVSTHKGDSTRFMNKLRNSSSIMLIAGKRGSGKSVLGFRILENVHAKSKRPCFVLGVDQKVLPEWIASVEKLDDVGNNGVVLVDEGALTFGSRDSMSKQNKELGKLLAVARHKDLTLILLTQNTGMIDKNVLNLCDTVLLKEGSLLQQKMERSVMKDLYRAANEALAILPAEDRKKHVFIFDDDFEGICNVPLPSFWNQKISKNQA